MAKGKQVITGNKLVNFNSKVQPGTKDMVDAIVKVKSQGISSTREFLEKAVDLYRQAYPSDMVKVEQYLEIMGKVENNL